MKFINMDIKKFFLLFVIFGNFSFSSQIKILNSYRTVSKLFFGVNSLYWIDNDRTRNDPEYISALKAAKVSIIRYPGGEVADNFDWKSNRLNNPRAYPYSKEKCSYKKRMNFDEFVEWKDKIGSKAILVVNLEEGFIEGNLKKAAKKAAEWVKYSNIEKKYNIKYWEIGNESYHLGTRYPLTAKEYAKALKLFSREMKKVDPTIKIGAVGPWDYRKVPIVEYLPKRKVEELRSVKSFKERKRLAKSLKRQYRNQRVKEWKKSWWEVIAEEASGSFDFAVIHRYTNRRIHDRDLRKPLRCDRPVLKLRSFLEKITGKDYPIALTEYNVGRRSAQGLSSTALNLTLAEMIGDYLKAGVDIGNYWPLRLKDKRAMFSLRNMKKRSPYFVFKSFSSYCGDLILKASSTNPMIYVLASKNIKKKELIIFVINKQKFTDDVSIYFPIETKISNILELNNSYYPDKLGKSSLDGFKKKFRTIVDPLSLTIMIFKYQ